MVAREVVFAQSGEIAGYWLFRGGLDLLLGGFGGFFNLLLSRFRGALRLRSGSIGGLFDLFLNLLRSFLELCLGGFGKFHQGGLATGGSILLQEALFRGLVIFGLSFGKILGSRIGFESFQCGFDGFLDLLVVCGALFGLTSGFFRRFDNRH